MRSHPATKLVYSMGLVMLVSSACGGGRTKIRMPQRDTSVRTEMSTNATGDSPGYPSLDEAQAELEAARKELAELEAAKAAAKTDPAEIRKLQTEVEQANQRVAAAENELRKKDKDAQATIDKMKSDLAGFSIQYKHSLKCLDIDGASMVDGAHILQMTCNQNNIQKFRLVTKSSGSWIQNVATGKCMATLNAGTGNSTPVVQSTCVENGSMLFTLQSDGNGYMFIKNAASNRCVDIEAISVSDRAGAQIYDCLNGDAQRVKTIPATP